MPALTTAEREAFLAQPGILVRIATLRETGAPMVTPAWFLRQGDDILITPRKESAWLANVRRDPRVALTIDEEAHPYRKLTVEGTVRIAFDIGRDDEWRDTYRQIARRYVPPEAAERYIQETIDQPRALLAVSLVDSKVSTWRMPQQGEAYSGIWHQRYYVEGSKLAEK
jgi:PPOX class probable F420-dependent enzyme